MKQRAGKEEKKEHVKFKNMKPPNIYYLWMNINIFLKKLLLLIELRK